MLQAVARALPVPNNTVIVEIGPGKGALTEYLLMKKRTVFAIEKDGGLCSVLKERFADAVANGTFVLHHGDVRDEGWVDFVQHTPYVVIANIPYYLTGFLIRDLLTHSHPPNAMALVVQREIAERITKRDGKESILSLSVQFFGVAHYGMTIQPNAFSPPPAVDSALVTITDICTRSQEVQDEFFRIVHIAFHEKRKNVFKKFDNEPQIQRILTAHSIDRTARAENVPFAVWLDTAREKTG